MLVQIGKIKINMGRREAKDEIYRNWQTAYQKAVKDHTVDKLVRE